MGLGLRGVLAILVCAWPALMPATIDTFAQNSGTVESPESEPPPHVPYWQVIEEQGFLSGGFAQHHDPDHGDLSGPTMSWGLWAEAEYIGGFSLWLTSVAGGEQRVTSGGFEVLGPFTLPLGPVRILPTFRLGVENRRAPPDDGYGGLAALGLETAVWL